MHFFWENETPREQKLPESESSFTFSDRFGALHSSKSVESEALLLWLFQPSVFELRAVSFEKPEWFLRRHPIRGFGETKGFHIEESCQYFVC